MSAGALTESYVQEVVRRVPADQRDDIANELHATIADAVDAREESDRAAAERAVLTEMGDPIRLAARYADRPLTLIGPELYPTYVRVLTVLLGIALPAVTATIMVLDVLDGTGIGAAIGTGVGTVLTVGAQMVAWLTLVFASVERFGPRGAAQAWTPADLPSPRRPDEGRRGAIAAVAWEALMLGLIVWQATAEPFRADGERMQVLDPDLWSGWMWPIVAGLVAVIAVNLVRVARQEWTVALAGWHAAAQALVTLPLAWVVYRQDILNPEFLAAVNGDDWTTPDSFYTAVTLIVLAIGVSETYGAFRKALR
ncbi:hypothetical protein BJF79_13270 [Actinomadura sp. CNU-125]|uniref:HAAS signaling domain-containing protein n=1 Tax=Actinomadura sp. CNU-125 TaxID=1904961 RepID=UPI00096313D5|nr:hypothetical protein [Actinomadura sp. CNU-125]OLT24718.1 hypothetical protein BJF79_13270 [Actinomadura sp. CNU-125]